MKQHVLILLLILFVMLPSLASARLFARWHTSMGSFTAELYDELVPITANNFRDLANSGFYNDLIFHRVIDGFMIQDGCPYGTGYGGPGYTIEDEFHPDLYHDHAGVLAMAHSAAPNSAGSQYYITVAPATHLDGDYAIFGDIIEGLDNVLAIGAVPTDANDRPLEPVNIHTLRMLDLQIGEFFPPLDETLSLLPGQSQFFMAEAYTQEAELFFEWYIDDLLIDEDSFLLETSFETGGEHTVRCHIASSDSISFDALWQIDAGVSAAQETVPALHSSLLNASPNPFTSELDINCELKSPRSVRLEIFNLKGQKVRTLDAARLQAGSHTYTWDGKTDQGKDSPAGIYLIRLKSDQQSIFRKISKI